MPGAIACPGFNLAAFVLLYGFECYFFIWWLYWAVEVSFFVFMAVL